MSESVHGARGHLRNFLAISLGHGNSALTSSAGWVLAHQQLLSKYTTTVRAEIMPDENTSNFISDLWYTKLWF
jgi:hypothetical protein